MRARRFSMLELVVVMVVAIILMTVGLSSFRDWRKGHEVDDGATSLGSLILQTRQVALAKRRYTALIMPGPETNTGLRDDQRYVVARIAYVTRSGSTYTFSSWVEDKDWVTMPAGVTIMEVDNDIGLMNTTFQRTPYVNTCGVVNSVNLSEGIGGSTNVASVRSLIFSPSGRLKADSSMYVTLGDGVFIGNTWIIRQNGRIKRTSDGQVYDIGPSNQVSVQINRFTGNITTIYPTQYQSGFVLQ